MTDTTWENLGVAFGGIACLAIASQVWQEWQTPPPSTMSLWFVVGFLLIYAFWFCYGVKFRRRALWLPNAMAIILQFTLLMLILRKTN